ncbi:argininosuccinate lyase [Aliidiomarina maris]|uniref:Argininosuccinate lyase n=1 Tax=Aliidiomarina maris TaxID=531312 RepID=A0A327X6L0_9GAMM|nr:argininosuccinate lyase [Aliidiomarina maris]RAJ98886.1 argininosuccinate lyase/amino-acid N-acetyltransferase [Aliidiomarina maris]RUO25032.1 argininosuccinate lyase [Aliidiomarina maris]
MSMWGGRFAAPTADIFKRFNDSLPFDYVLAPFEVEASKAWAKALQGAGIVSAEECEALIGGLEQLADELAQTPDLPVRDRAEDIHSWIEAKLQDTLGAVGKKLHTGRSRNDLVATDLKLWLKARLGHIQESLLGCIQGLLKFAQLHQQAVIPGYTHLQRAQPVLVAHWALAYVEMLERDHMRLQACLKHMNQSPLGCGALAGTGLNIDREALAQQLGFDSASENSLDAVSDRDFVVEALALASLSMVHLSRLCEDVVFYCSGEAGFFKLGDAISSGSSLMPQKKNPDVFELVRGKTGRVAGHLQAMLMTLKGLPLAYNKDLQEDKECLFDAMTQWHDALSIITYSLGHIEVDQQAGRDAAELGYSNATDLADYLVRLGVPFRDAHEQSGQLVLQAIDKGCALGQLELAEMQRINPDIQDDVYAVLELEAGLQARGALGGTSRAQVDAALKRAMLQFNAQKAELKQVRQARLSDVDAIHELITYWTGKGEHLPRPKADIMQAIHTFAVVEQDQKVVGCSALYVYGTGLAEIRSLGLKPGLEGQGLGAALVHFLMGQARELHIKRVIVLTRAAEFFRRLGFKDADKSRWPEKVMKDCELCPRRHNCDEFGLEFWITPQEVVPKVR